MESFCDAKRRGGGREEDGRRVIMMVWRGGMVGEKGGWLGGGV